MGWFLSWHSRQILERTDGELTFPCGACLQVALELAGPELTVVAADLDGEAEDARLGDLLVRAPRRNTYAPVAPVPPGGLS